MAPKKPKRKLSRKKKVDTRAKLFIVGESPLVEEYAKLCAAHGYAVAVQWNEAKRKSSFDKSSGIVRANVPPANTSLAIELTNTDVDQKKKNLQKLDRALPPTGAILSTSITVTAIEQASWISRKHRLVGICALPTFTQKPLVEVAPTVFSPKETLEVVSRFYRSIGKEITLVQDRVGMVLPRILCQIINEAVFAIQEDVASPQDIDTAMKLGTNYPFGPIEWADKIGVKQVCAVLAAIQDDLREERYRLAPLLKQMAQTGEWWKKT